jgi:hypothetical protein
MVNTPKLDIGGACHGINNQVMCVFYLSGGAGTAQRERCRAARNYSRVLPRALDWIIQINIDIKAHMSCVWKAAQVPKRERQACFDAFAVGGCGARSSN